MKLNITGQKVSTNQFKQDPEPSWADSQIKPVGSTKRLQLALVEVRTEEKKKKTKKCLIG